MRGHDMTLARAKQLQAECRADLTKAKEQNDYEWVTTLTKRMAFLSGIVTKERYNCAGKLADTPTLVNRMMGSL